MNTYKAIARATARDIFPGAIVDIRGGMYQITACPLNADQTVTLHVTPIDAPINPLMSTVTHVDEKFTIYTKI